MTYEKKVARLMDDTRELVATLRDARNPEVRRLRDRVDAFVSGPQRITPQRGNQRPVKITRIPSSIFDYVHHHPWLAIVTAASLAWTLGHLSSASRDQRP
jgi:ElaB/YqjD/DUF883 family membrane-anchored ribosome-binding protein